MFWDPTSQASLEISPIWLPVMEKEFKLCELGLLFLAYFCFLRGVSKKFSEWYQKTNKTEDTNKLTLLAFKIIAILHNTLLATFIKLLETVSKGLCRNQSQNRCHMFLDCRHVCKMCAFHDALQAGKQKHIFCSRLPSRTLVPTFHASPSPFSLICSRTWCSLVAPLHCDATSHTDHVWLPAAGLAWRSRVLCARWRFSMYLWIAMCMQAHLAHVAIEISDHSPNFLDTPRILEVACQNSS